MSTFSLVFVFILLCFEIVAYKLINLQIYFINLQKGTVLDAGGSQASFFMQAYTLTKRSFINMSRDFGYYWLRLVIYVVVTICIGTIYLNVGTGYNSILVLLKFREFKFIYLLRISINSEQLVLLNRPEVHVHHLSSDLSHSCQLVDFLLLWKT